MKGEVRKAFKKWKKGIEERDKYLHEKKKFTRPCKEKEQRMGEEEMKAMQNIRSETEIWKFITNT